MKRKAYSILMVDDSDDDRFILRRYISKLPRFSILHELTDGEQAVEYLSGNAPYHDRKTHPLPDLMLLDLKMPRRSGFEVLSWLRGHPLKEMTVIVLSGSNLGEDIGASLALGAHGFWTKTADASRQSKIAREIEELMDQRRALFTSHTPATPLSGSTQPSDEARA